MSNELAIEILKQATIETTTGACETCPRKDKNKTCIGCLDEAKENILNQLQQKENIIKEVREDLDKTIEFCTNEADGTTNDKICRITINYLKHLKETLEKENKQ